ncbi:MAG: nucleoside hydrolase [Chloroflexota bacterium]|nr:nucleoside hydrolase [Chloroflexota bacterium]
MPKPIILDTDIGSDVDDCMALLLACASPEIELVGVTTVGEEARKRARLAVQLLRRAGREDVPVYAGMSNRLLLQKPNHFRGYDGHGLNIEDVAEDEFEDEHAVDYLLRMARERGPELTLVPVGPLTNVAAAINLDGEAMDRFKELFVMGGVFWGERAQRGEYNVSSDPEATKVVLGLNAPTTFVGLDVTLQVVNDPERMAQLKGADTPLTDLAYSMLAHYQARLGRDVNYLHDPLALTCAFDEQFVQFVESPVGIVTEEGERRGVMELREGDSPKRLAREVDGSAFMDFLIERVIELGRQLA